MTRYEPLRRYLAEIPLEETEIRIKLPEIEALVGPLPASARQYREWWANGSHSHSAAWLDAGWKVDIVSILAETVVFVRGQAVQRAVAAEVVTREADQTEAIVQAYVVEHLIAEGWRIQSAANTASREPGHDILAVKGERTLAVEVKGYPSRAYADPRRADETKPTNPNTQARHWYAQALMKSVLTRDEHEDYDVMMAFPDKPTYRSLWRRTARSLAALRIGVLFVTVEGDVARGETAGAAT